MQAMRWLAGRQWRCSNSEFVSTRLQLWHMTSAMFTIAIIALYKMIMSTIRNGWNKFRQLVVRFLTAKDISCLQGGGVRQLYEELYDARQSNMPSEERR